MLHDFYNLFREIRQKIELAGDELRSVIKAKLIGNQNNVPRLTFDFFPRDFIGNVSVQLGGLFPQHCPKTIKSGQKFHGVFWEEGHPHGSNSHQIVLTN